MQLFIWIQTWEFKQMLTVHHRVILDGFIGITNINLFFPQITAFEWVTPDTQLNT